jgi:hypothetical protein
VSSFYPPPKTDLEAIPVPDRETQAALNVLKKKTRLDPQEADFLKYAQLRRETVKAVEARGKQRKQRDRQERW